METSARPLVLQNVIAITPFRRQPNSVLVLNNGVIDQMGQPEDVKIPPHAEILDLNNQYVLPGFIDLHCHGGVGHDFCDGSDDAIDEISQFHASKGTTSLMATIYPQPRNQLFQSIQYIRSYCESNNPNRILEGIHLEGPFLNPEMHGAIRADWMWEPNVDDFRALIEAGGPWIRYMTIAPELPGAMDVIRAASLGKRTSRSQDDGWPLALYLSVGHSRALYEELVEAIDNGLEGVTHIFNAMPTMHHRKPGVLAGTMLRDELFVEVIADALHVHPAILQLLLKVKNYDRILLVTDSIRAAGMPDGQYVFSNQDIEVRHGRAYLAHSPDTLAGSTLTMEKAVRTMVRHAGCSLEQAAQMASLNAARVLAWKYRRGILAVGKDADLVVMDESLHTTMTIKSGRIVFSADRALYHA